MTTVSTPASEIDAGLARLTQRERDCLRALRDYGEAKFGARSVNLELTTFNTHLAKARRKLGVGRSWDAARLLAEHEAILNSEGPRRHASLTISPDGASGSSDPAGTGPAEYDDEGYAFAPTGLGLGRNPRPSGDGGHHRPEEGHARSSDQRAAQAVALPAAGGGGDGTSLHRDRHVGQRLFAALVDQLGDWRGPVFVVVTSAALAVVALIVWAGAEMALRFQSLR